MLLKPVTSIYRSMVLQGLITHKKPESSLYNLEGAYIYHGKDLVLQSIDLWVHCAIRNIKKLLQRNIYKFQLTTQKQRTNRVNFLLQAEYAHRAHLEDAYWWGRG